MKPESQSLRSIFSPEELSDGVIVQALSEISEIPYDKLSIISLVGKGNFGSVSKAKFHSIESNSDVIVAVKSLLENNSLDAELNIRRRLLLQEAALMCNLDHPNVVHLLGYSLQASNLHLILEYCSFGELSTYLRENQETSNDQLLAFCVECAVGLEYLASKGIVHRDLAARNILLDVDLTCKVADYGMSRSIEGKRYYRSIGCPMPVRWTAPEALDSQVFTEQTDVWSFGVLLYEIWTKGGIPYHGMNEREVWAAVVEGHRLPCPMLCPAALYSLMQQCWQETGSRPNFTEISSKLRSQGVQRKRSQLFYLNNIAESKPSLAFRKSRLQSYLYTSVHQIDIPCDDVPNLSPFSKAKSPCLPVIDRITSPSFSLKQSEEAISPTEIAITQLDEEPNVVSSRRSSGSSARQRVREKQQLYEPASLLQQPIRRPSTTASLDSSQTSNTSGSSHYTVLGPSLHGNSPKPQFAESPSARSTLKQFESRTSASTSNTPAPYPVYNVIHEDVPLQPEFDKSVKSTVTLKSSLYHDEAAPAPKGHYHSMQNSHAAGGSFNDDLSSGISAARTPNQSHSNSIGIARQLTESPLLMLYTQFESSDKVRPKSNDGEQETLV